MYGSANEGIVEVLLRHLETSSLCRLSVFSSRLL